jgi:hypothetical protein
VGVEREPADLDGDDRLGRGAAVALGEVVVL